MACGTTSPPVTKRLHTSTTVEQVEPFSSWQPAVGLDKVKMVVKRRSVNLAGTSPVLTLKPVYRIALVRPDDAGAWNAITGQSGWTTADNNTGTIDISAYTAGQAWIQWGIAYTVSGSGTLDAQADVEVTISTVSCGRSVGTRSQELNTFNTTSNTHQAITGWIPVIDVEKVIAFFIITNIANNFRCQLSYRTAETSTQSTSAWALLEGASYRTSNGETSTGEITMSLTGTSYMWVQFGIAFGQSTAIAAPGTASVTTSVSVRRA